MIDDAQFRTWKTSLVPILYDWLSNHNLTWPSQTCRWGPKIEEFTYKIKYRLYLSEQTDGSEPNKLMVYNVDVCKPRVASCDTVASWTELTKCPYIKDYKTIYHPGEVNKIREIQQAPHLIVTHTDAPELYLWNIEKQPSRVRDKSGKQQPLSEADLVLTGHQDVAQFPLCTSALSPTVGSGGTDKLVLLWNIADSMETVLAGNSGGKKNPTLKARTVLKGHTATVEDAVFRPGSDSEVVSVGDDHQILLWDTRSGNAPVAKVPKAHNKSDIQAVDWSVLREHMLATGANDGSLKVWDPRKLTGGDTTPLHVLRTAAEHGGEILRVEFHPQHPGILASGGEDRVIRVWDLQQRRDASSKTSSKGVPDTLLFQHMGHRQGKVVDFQWCPDEAWTMLSVSDDTEEGGGGTLQVWRMNDMIYRPEEEVLAELEQHREFMVHGRDAPKPSRDKEHKDKARRKDKDTVVPEPEGEGGQDEGVGAAWGATIAVAEGGAAAEGQEDRKNDIAEMGEPTASAAGVGEAMQEDVKEEKVEAKKGPIAHDEADAPHVADPTAGNGEVAMDIENAAGGEAPSSAAAVENGGNVSADVAPTTTAAATTDDPMPVDALGSDVGAGPLEQPRAAPEPDGVSQVEGGASDAPSLV